MIDFDGVVPALFWMLVKVRLDTRLQVARHRHRLAFELELLQFTLELLLDGAARRRDGGRSFASVSVVGTTLVTPNAP